jgi:hypothetical protein
MAHVATANSALACQTDTIDASKSSLLAPVLGLTEQEMRRKRFRPIVNELDRGEPTII